jgi:hypothetical protein
MGFGVHAHGTADWDGRSPAFSQFLDDGSVPGLSDEDFGSFVDLDAFKRTGRGRNAESFPARLAIRLLTRSANRRVAALRGGVHIGKKRAFPQPDRRFRAASQREEKVNVRYCCHVALRFMSPQPIWAPLRNW